MAARRAARNTQSDSKPETVDLVSPDGAKTVNVTIGGADDARYRFDGFLPAKQHELAEPEPVPSPGEQTVGTNPSA